MARTCPSRQLRHSPGTDLYLLLRAPAALLCRCQALLAAADNKLPPGRVPAAAALDAPPVRGASSGLLPLLLPALASLMITDDDC